jgi:hypothetical protein
MINIGPLYPLVSTPKTHKNPSHDKVIAGTEINKDAQRVIAERERKRRRGEKDRRQRNLRPLIDLRIGRDRRDSPDVPSIDIEV